ncbi:sensor histidine kinase [Isoptericola dokdonensis]|jgi:signal transduction histidine kinase|uniref:histidine kinase n=1 Tax=Isoptericola dokdonensis DS-3 TaxID=1300344 RepID=A0A161HS53_9MICO|nr:histidine kinase [Isoptericola dokdonensis]ANC32222.1 Sensor histidine kinase DesK [Isoptericola dokdonensis DS-3]
MAPPLTTLRLWFALDADFERWPADPRAAYRRDVWLGLTLTVLAVLGTEVARSSGTLWQDQEQPTWVLYLLTVAGTLPLTLRRRYPLAVLAVVYTHFLLVGLTVPAVVMTPVLQVVYFMTLYAAVAWARDRRAMLLVVSASLLAMFGWLFWQLAISTALQEYLDEAGLLDDPPGLIAPLTAVLVSNWLTNVAYFLGAIAAGQLSWNSARRRAQLAAQARTIALQAEALQEQAVVADRLRIARELHDVVAHHVSVIGIHAAAAGRLLGKGAAPDDVRAPLATIETASRDAVEQMRGLVGTLRGADGGGEPRAGRSPEPGLADVAALARADDGLDVTYLLVADPPDVVETVPAPLGLSLYRTVQEALANVRKHSTARSARVTVRVDARPVPDDRRFAHGYVEAEVIDDGRARPGSGGSGLGLMGLRERVAAHHGLAEIGPRVTGGYRVRVRLPLPEETP